jgi:hypothetical protein
MSEKFARKCSVTGEGMNEGYVIRDGEKYFKYEHDAIQWAILNGYQTLGEAYKLDELYWTSWEDESEYMYIEVNGVLVEIEDVEASEIDTEEYIIISKTTIQKRIEELESKIIPNPNFDSEIDSHNLLFITKQNELNKILSQSTPLIPEIEKAFDAGRKLSDKSQLYTPDFYWIKEEYISQLKLDT